MQNTEAIRLNWLKSVNLTSEVFLQNKRAQLAELIALNAHLPEQGTDEWLAVRRFSIGGSEMSTITGDGGFSNLKRLVAGKIGLSKFQGRLATRWGKMFENVTTLFMEDVLDIDGKIQETSSIEGAIPGQRYSPDGLAVIKMLCGKHIGGEYIERYEYLTILFEFKSPYSGIPNGKIAKYYVPQVMTGMCSIPIADLALFVNNMFRKCSLKNFDYTVNYDKYFHNKDEGKVVVEEPLAIGLIFIYFKDETRKKFLEKYSPDPESDSDEESDSDGDMAPMDYDAISGSTKTSDQEVIDGLLAQKVQDFGKSNYYAFDQIMKLFDEGLVDVHYCEPLVVQKNLDQVEFLQIQSTPKEQNLELELVEYKKQIQNFDGLVGYIPYKLFKSDIIIKNRDPNYLKPHKEKVMAVINQIKDIMANTNDDLDEIHKKFRIHFPSRNDWIDREIDNHMEHVSREQSCQHMIPKF
jgi:hypothetical protein